jgi:hypothetical protein
MTSPEALPNFSSRYQLPIFYHNTLESLGTDSPDALHFIDLEGWRVPILFRYRSSPVLNIMFTGAVDRTRSKLPFFERVESSSRWEGSVLFVSDDTLRLFPDLGIGWYVGIENSDYMAVVCQVVQYVQALCQATKLIFSGGSAGGFAALMASHRFAGSLAYVFNPQTHIPAYRPVHVQRLMAYCFPQARNNLSETLLRRLSCLEVYRTDPSTNRIYYLNNASDTFHIQNFLVPFAQLFDLPPEGGLSSDGRVQVVIEDYSPGAGHIAAPTRVYEDHRQKALALAGF